MTKRLPALLLSLGLTLAATVARAQSDSTATAPAAKPASEKYTGYRYRSLAFTPTQGWNTPYGIGLETSVMVIPSLDINVGGGLALSGVKLGIGSRYYILPKSQLSPFVGGNVVLASGTGRAGSDIGYEFATVIADIVGDEYDPETAGDYVVRSSVVGHLRTGLRWQPGKKKPSRVGFLGTIGYGFRLTSDPIVYNPDYPKPTAVEQSITRSLFAPGGLELALQMSIGIGKVKQ
ncbi:hypothetical protein LJY25_17090 [Hymenobacter sp. BT175]|uniref:hypothetical protein n=1 Tax=Hymenobacter translucens TaxID=2886507 RepID=UPI001D0EB5C2|nr:hypothetical protein [Hymenobacter translucens]MCC2548168.1 hypothetical protein [Hymenobacter translucens]